MGLEIANISGNYYLFAGGTGILPFLDILDFVLKKSIYTVIKKKVGEVEAKKMDVYEEDYDQEMKDFKFILYGAFVSWSDFPGSNIVERLYRITKENELPWFDMKIKISKQEPSDGEKGNLPLIKNRFDMNFLQSNIDVNATSGVYICGPPIFNQTIPLSLETMGLPESKITIV